MSDLARRLHRVFCGDDRLSDCPFEKEHRVEAAEAIAYVKEKLGPLVDKSCGVSGLWCSEHKQYHCLKLDAILALLDEPTPEPERRDG
jgi:hypothetical protein